MWKSKTAIIGRSGKPSAPNRWLPHTARRVPA